jgi:transposase
MLHVGLDLSRTRLDVHAMNEAGTPVLVTTAAPDAGGLASLVARVGEFGQPVAAAIESMTGARFVHDQLELGGWEVEVADAVKVKGLAPLAAKTDRIDAWVLAELSRRDLVPAIWLPDRAVRAERERARWRLHLVRHRTALKNRIHATLLTFGHPCPVADLFGVAGRQLLADLHLPEPWAGDVAAALALIDDLDEQINGCEAALRTFGADHPYVPLLTTVPGIGPVLGVHHRRRDRRHRPVFHAEEAGRLHRAVPDGLPVRPQGPPALAGQERTEVPALGADRGGHPRRPPSGLRRALPADPGPPR